MSGGLASEIRKSLAASRSKADHILSTAEAQALRLSELAGETDRQLAEARLERLAGLRREIEMHHERIEVAYAAMAEAMATAAVRLTEASREADFSIPEWPEDIRTAFELKLTETREMTIRIARESGGRGSGAEGSRIASFEEKRAK